MSELKYLSSKTLFSDLLNRNLHLNDPLRSVLLIYEDRLEPSFPENLTEFKKRLSEIQSQKRKSVQAESEKETLIHFTPSAFLYGSWLLPLQRIPFSYSETGQTALHSIQLFNGSTDNPIQRVQKYRSILFSQEIYIPSLFSADFIQDRRFTEADFHYAIPSLLFEKCTENDSPEILGYHSAKMFFGLPLCVEQSLPIRWFSTDEENTLSQSAFRMIESVQKKDSEFWRRLWNGVIICILSEEEWIRSLSFKRKTSLWDRMEEILKSKFEHSSGYHDRIIMDGKSLDEWMRSGNIRNFLENLSVSDWVVPGNPEKSPLFSSSVSFGGKMFGIFTEKELMTVSGWISLLKENPSPQWNSSIERKYTYNLNIYIKDFDAHTVFRMPAADSRKIIFHKRKKKSDSLNPRKLMQKLVQKQNFPESVSESRLYIKNMLMKTEKKMNSGKLKKENLIPFQKDTLQNWLKRRMDEQVNKNLPLSGEFLGKAVSRADAVWVLLQLAPASLADGGWLQRISSSELSDSAETGILHEIYRDELGSGILDQHHGIIMKNILKECGKELPSIDSDEFYQDKEIIDAAFNMPAYWLSLSEHQKEFFPELLGLNLAVEIAGLGKGYGLMIDFLKFHGINPYFFSLHNTIDNAASGHTALSIRAIQSWTDSVLKLNSDPEPDWKRIWTGFYSYETAGHPLTIAFLKKFGWKVLLQKIKSLW
ncbi:MAG TPA: iron-containing redox enzyme family protein [Leptospiraceae bacterium]|nr:iron-containing redox enzyme family protein [Leptospiraceae bacterium]HNM04848.1 iron-containing redox enzyme family protein [Leptospiraceae bacterium]